ncbi:MAG TPA: acyl-CoA synthetase FdrA [Patescibacteria group bacterium]|nr:acyl-CoA synthetase FdrA [Patescibacteria group bacterium]
MSETRSEVRSGAYYDSVMLMQLQRSLSELPGVEDAGVIMATPANCEILTASGLPIDSSAGPDDLLIVIRAEDSDSAEGALDQIDELLARRRSSASHAFRPRSLESAVKQLPDSQWVLISVPGRYAAGVAQDALALGRNVFLFSDNVSLEEEIKLKNMGRDQGLLVMGPDCGTAIIGGVGFGFANRVRQGKIGLLGASGTGMQAISSYIHNKGGGISQAIGTGGRDLKREVGAMAAHQGLDLLARDSESEVIVIVSKPPHPEVAAAVLNHAAKSGKPVVVDFIGQAPPAKRLGNLHFAVSLQDAADLAVSLSSASAEAGVDILTVPASDEKAPRYIRGLFSGGTLAYEAVLALSSVVSPVYSNAAVYEWQQLADVMVSQKHTIIDMGEDDFTQGRLHPMMDNDLRLRRLRQEAADPEVGAIILDLVLGEGSHPDPASEIAPVIEEAIDIAKRNGRNLEIAAIVIGTDEDSQIIEEQTTKIATAGAMVFNNTSDAVYYVSTFLPVPKEPNMMPLSLAAFARSVAVINVGLEVFFDSLEIQGASVVQVDWRPPAGGNEKLMSLLSQLKYAH